MPWPCAASCCQLLGHADPGRFAPQGRSCVSPCRLVDDEDRQKHQRGTAIEELQGSVYLFIGGGFGPIF